MNEQPKLKSHRALLSRLPAHVREEINMKLYDGWLFSTVGDWLYNQVADRDIPDLDLKKGDPYSIISTRTSKDEKTARATFRYHISRWYRSHHQDWLRKAIETSQAMRLVDRVEHLVENVNERDIHASRKAGDYLIRALLLEAIEKAHTDTKDPAKIIDLANAWSKLR